MAKIDLENLGLYSPESLRQGGPFNFDIQEINSKISQNNGKEGYAIRLGGSHLEIRPWVIRGEKLKILDDLHGYKGIYLDETEKLRFLDEVEYVANVKQCASYGISAAGLITGTRYVSANVPVFQVEFEKEYEGDFGLLFGKKKFALANDAHASIIAAGYHLLKDQEGAPKNIVLQVVGTGVGGAVLKAGEKNGQGSIYTIEPGHIPARSLNIFSETEKSQFCKCETPVEKVLSGPSIARAWEREFGERIQARDISEKLITGTPSERDFADRLVGNVALGVAQTFAGICKTFELECQNTILVAHGSVWKIFGFSERVHRILDQCAHHDMQIYCNHESIDKWDIEGAAILGATI